MENAVDKRCKVQKKLILLIGSAEHWDNIHASVNVNLQFNVLDYFNGMLFTRLTEHWTTFFSNFTLAVVVNDQTEDVNFLQYLQLFISAYSGTLTTLQVIFNAKNVTFQSIFYPLVASINELQKLQRLSFYDHSDRLVVPPFDSSFQLFEVSHPGTRLFQISK